MTKRDLLSMEDLTRSDVELILDTAESFLPIMHRDIKKVPTLRGRTIVNFFYEASTRTSTSFDLAAKRLSADTIALKKSGSSVEKGESLKDTVLTLTAYSPDIIVIRHPSVGACRLVARQTRPASSTPATASTSTPHNVCSTCSPCAKRLVVHWRECASPSWATSCTAGWRAPTSRAFR